MPTPYLPAVQLSDRERLTIPAHEFGQEFWLIESLIFRFAEILSPHYNGGYWEFMITPDTHGFYMKPNTDHPLEVESLNQIRRTVSADAFGIVCCLFAYSHGAFSYSNLADELTLHYHRVREHALNHPEAGSILALID